jgi:hypothetical protein
MSASFSGYAITPTSPKWLFRFLPPSQCRSSCIGEPVEFEPRKFGHRPVPKVLGAQFAILAYDTADQARRLPQDSPEHRSAMRKVDYWGRGLAVKLRAATGPGPVIVYSDQFRKPALGSGEWQVSDTGEFRPYWHHPSAGYVIGQEVGGEWACAYRPAGRHMARSSIGVRDRWHGDRPIPQDLLAAFSQLHSQWNEVAFGPQRWCESFDWDAHNQQGLVLAARLKQSFGAGYRVIYRRPYEEPAARKQWVAVELRMDGSNRVYEHRPYWLSSQFHWTSQR